MKRNKPFHSQPEEESMETAEQAAAREAQPRKSKVPSESDGGMEMLRKALAGTLVMAMEYSKHYEPVIEAHAKHLANGYAIESEKAKLVLETFSAAEHAKRKLLESALEAEDDGSFSLIEKRLEFLGKFCEQRVEYVEVPHGPRHFQFTEVDSE